MDIKKWMFGRIQNNLKQRWMVGWMDRRKYISAINKYMLGSIYP